MGTNTARSSSWLAAGGGAVVGAAAAVGLLLALGWSGDSSAPDRTVGLPETAGGLRTEAVVMPEERRDALLQRQAALSETAELLSVSRGGAETAVQSYLADEFEEHFTIWAVADESPPLWSSQDGEAVAELQGTKTPMEWVERDGDVECLVRTVNPVLRDSDAEVAYQVTHCQLVHDGVTLIFQGASQDDVRRPAQVLREVATHIEAG